MNRIETFETALRTNNLNGLNATVLRAYRNALKNENDLIDFESFNDSDIEKITACLKENGIEAITISSTDSNLLASLAAFEANGYKAEGLTQVNKPADDWRSTGFDKAPAMKLHLN